MARKNSYKWILILLVFVDVQIGTHHQLNKLIICTAVVLLYIINGLIVYFHQKKKLEANT